MAVRRLLGPCEDSSHAWRGLRCTCVWVDAGPETRGCLLVFLLAFSRIANWSTFSGQSLVMRRLLCRAVSIGKKKFQKELLNKRGNLNVCDIVIFFFLFTSWKQSKELYSIKLEKLSWSYPSQTTETFLSLKNNR